RDAGAAIEFYKRAFGAIEGSRTYGPDGKLILNAEIRIGDSPLLLMDESPAWGSTSPLSLGGSPVLIHLYVEDVDAAFDRATKAGAKVILPVTDQFWGDRYGMIVDPFGHHWSIATHTEDLSTEEIAQRQAAASKT
ncbi:MAG TPA: VOC family protein, partial [Nitrospiraceae bacterium]|nr:VOC family protein [Nitrospiraceae bacterium]